MTFAPAMWTAWSAFVVFMAALYIYRSNLGRNEADQIFLVGSFSHEQAEQAAIATKIAKVEPVARVTRWLVVAMSGFVVAYYVRDILLQLHLIE